MVVGFALACIVLIGTSSAVAHNHDHHETVIPHQDGTGTATIVEVPRGIPGTESFLRASPGPIPQPGELVFAPTSTPTSTPVPQPTPQR
jgi:hypothetical protein